VRYRRSAAIRHAVGLERHAIASPKGRDQGRTFVAKFTADAMSEGLVKAAIARAGLRGAMTSDQK